MRIESWPSTGHVNTLLNSLNQPDDADDWDLATTLRIRIHARQTDEVLNKAVQNIPIPEISALSGHFRDLYGNREHTPIKHIDAARSMAIADDYDAMQHDPYGPHVQRSYNALKHQTREQWDHMHANGYKAEPWVNDGQPYANSAALMHDLAANKHIYFFPTLGTSGASYGESGDEPTEHPMLEPAGIAINGKHLTYNDMFRAVHDFYGHGAHGYQFGPVGEENAWRKHRTMFSMEAVPALTSETRGQNSWINFGKHLRIAGQVPGPGDPRWLHPALRPYAQQKAGILPPHHWEE